jgi:hypothetical protein
MVMDANGKRGNGRQGNQLQPHYESKSQPPYDFYLQGVAEAHRGLFEILRKASGKYLVPIGAIWALYEIAGEFLKSGSNHFDDKPFFGVLLVSGMLLAIAIVSLRRTEDTDAGQKENRKESKVEPAESGAGGNSPGQDRRITARNRGTNTNGGSK